MVKMGEIMGPDKNWEAKSDFYSLSEAEAIKSDKKRYNAALKAGQSVVKEKQQTVNEMKKVAMKKAPMKKSAPKRSMKRKK
jgi:hypothetical protein